MKKIVAILFMGVMAISFTACGTTSRDVESVDNISGAAENSAINESKTPATSDTPTDRTESATESTEKGKRVLVVYFSATGTTKKLAEYAADSLEADLYEIVPAEPYTAADLSYNNDDCRANREMNDKNCRPEINGSVKNMADYDIVLLGYPIWWGETPRILSTFVERYDFSGKTVVTFCTSGSSPNNDSVIKALTSGANWISGSRLNGNSSPSDIAAWIDSLNLD